MADGPNAGHEFGGNWTELKLDAVQAYLHFYVTALKNQNFQLWYIDAFAGTGTRRRKRKALSLLGEPEQVDDLAGSVLRALETDPPFEHHIFIEQKQSHSHQLETLARDYPERHIRIVRGDANACLATLFDSSPWKFRRFGTKSPRAICFLDPYGMSVEWSTLELLASTGAVDVWYLFPLAAVSRQLAGRLDRVDEHKRRALDRIFGTSRWETEIYEQPVNDLFGHAAIAQRKLTTEEIATFGRNRLERIFRYVSPPLPLLNTRKTPLFLLFCMSNSRSDRAIALVDRCANHIMRKYGPASR